MAAGGQSANRLRMDGMDVLTCLEAGPAIAGLRIFARSGIVLTALDRAAKRRQKDCASIATTQWVKSEARGRLKIVCESCTVTAHVAF